MWRCLLLGCFILLSSCATTMSNYKYRSLPEKDSMYGAPYAMAKQPTGHVIYLYKTNGYLNKNNKRVNLSLFCHHIIEADWRGNIVNEKHYGNGCR